MVDAEFSIASVCGCTLLLALERAFISLKMGG